MLVVDGCFIIEYLAKRVFKQTPGTAHLANVRWGFAHLRRDLMLLENQIPFFVLVKLFEQSEIPFVGSREKPLTLMDLALAFFGVNTAEASRPPVEDVLHLHHHCLDPEGLPRRSTDQIQNVLRMIPCATELRQAGVKFRQKDAVDSYLKVSFSEGTMEIPRLSVEDATSTRLCNFIALEQCYPEVGSYFTSYGILMDNIINTKSDVAILRKHRIIESKLGSDGEVAKMFNTLCKGTHLKYQDHYNARLFKDVTEYCEVARHRWRASLERTHIRSPWAIISILAGFLLLALTLTQTVFTIIK